jgi:hypothetical protein
MSTRCNIKITDDKKTYYLYRHWDGYPAETGAHVLEIAEAINHPAWENGYASKALQAVNRFFGKIRHNENDDSYRSHYELTERPHGDIEHFYHIEFLPDSKVWIGYAKGYGPKLENETVPYVPEMFKMIVNDERKYMNRNLEIMKEENPGVYDQYEPYPML